MNDYIWCGWGRHGNEDWSRAPLVPTPPVNPNGDEPALEQVVDMKHLMRVYDRLRREAGQAPGADGIGYDQMGRIEAGNVLRAKSKAILRDRWLPDPTRPVRIPKLTGGHRVLNLPTVGDRILYAALNDYLSPFWERHSLPRSHGFRPGHSRFHLLAHLDHEITTTGRTVLVVDDVRKAFDNVRQADCLTAHRQYLQGERLLAYIHTVLRGNNPRRTTGIDQGNAYSPTALNALLHVHHDQRLDAQGEGQTRQWYRYADNLIYLTTDVTEGRHVRQIVMGLLQETGMDLKGNGDVITDIQHNPAEVLGISIQMADGQVTYTIPDLAWVALDRALLACHESKNPPEAARSAIRGWVGAYGPSLANLTDATLDRIYRTGTRNRFRELPNRDVLAECARDAHRRWDCLRQSVRQQNLTVSEGAEADHLHDALGVRGSLGADGGPDDQEGRH